MLSEGLRGLKVVGRVQVLQHWHMSMGMGHSRVTTEARFSDRDGQGPPLTRVPVPVPVRLGTRDGLAYWVSV